MPIVQTILPLRQTVNNGHFIGPGSALSILPLEPLCCCCCHRRVVLALDPAPFPAPAPAPAPVPPEVIDLTEEPSDNQQCTARKKKRERASLPAATAIIEISDDEVGPEPRRLVYCRGRTSMLATRDIIWTGHGERGNLSTNLHGKVAILFFSKVYHPTF